MGAMKSIKAVFKDGAFIPLEPCNVPNGTEAVVVFIQEEKRPKWWEELPVKEEKKEALLKFTERVKRFSPIELKAVITPEGFELFFITRDSQSALKPIMEEGLRVYEETSVYLPIQVISLDRLNRWKEQGNRIYKQIEEGVSLL